MKVRLHKYDSQLDSPNLETGIDLQLNKFAYQPDLDYYF